VLKDVEIRLDFSRFYPFPADDNIFWVNGVCKMKEESVWEFSGVRADGSGKSVKIRCILDKESFLELDGKFVLNLLEEKGEISGKNLTKEERVRLEKAILTLPFKDFEVLEVSFTSPNTRANRKKKVKWTKRKL